MNNGFAGITTTRNPFNVGQSASTSAAGSSMGFNKAFGAAGFGLEAAGGLVALSGNYAEKSAIDKSAALLEQQSNISLSQIHAEQEVNDISAIRNATSLSKTQNVQFNQTGASTSSPTYFALQQSTFNAAANKEFIDQTSATAATVNALYQKQEQLNSLQQAGTANSIGGIGSIISTGVGIAGLTALLL